MTFDTIIIGGGLSGLTAGIALQQRGQKVAIAAYGQSTLSSFSGSLDLLGYDAEGNIVDKPLEAIAALGKEHPYSKIGAECTAQLAKEAVELLAAAGVKLKGDGICNHLRITPMGVAKPAWLTLDDCLTADPKFQILNFKFHVLNIAGFLDFPVEFIAAGLEKMGAQVTVHTVPIKTLQSKRKSPYETRATSIARLMEQDEELCHFAESIAAVCTAEEEKNFPPARGGVTCKVEGEGAPASIVLLPAVLGLANDEALQKLRRLVGRPVYVIATLPPSLLGARLQSQLRSRFTALGGKIYFDTKIVSGTIEDNRIVSVSRGYSSAISADNYILATGSFQSHGLVAGYQRVVEPLFGLNVDYAANRSAWTAPDIFAAQPYMTFGVHTDADFHPLKGKASIDNLYAIGSILSGHNALTQADGTGVSLITALAAAKNILNKK